MICLPAALSVSKERQQKSFGDALHATEETQQRGDRWKPSLSRTEKYSFEHTGPKNTQGPWPEVGVKEDRGTRNFYTYSYRFGTEDVSTMLSLSWCQSKSIGKASHYSFWHYQNADNFGWYFSIENVSENDIPLRNFLVLTKLYFLTENSSDNFLPPDNFLSPSGSNISI